MIEAVTSAVSNAQVSRGTSENLAAQRSVEVNAAPANAEAVRAPVAPFVSPYISVDLSSNKAVIQIRDSDTGDVVNQFPSEQTLQSRQRNAELQAGVDSSSAQQSARTSAPASTAFVASEATSVANAPSGAGAAQIASAALSSGAQANSVSTAVISTSA